MEIKSLRYFVKIVDLASMSRAARALYVAQPALSQQVASLERELNAKLLVRSPKGVVPTPKGEIVYRHALSVMRQLEQIRIDVAAGAEQLYGHVAIGMPSSTAAILALPLLKAVKASYPGICLEISESGVSVLREWLCQGRLDLAVLYVDGENRPPGEVRLLTESLCLVTAADRPASTEQEIESVSILELVDEPLVISSPTVGMRHVVDRAFASVGRAPNVVAEINMLRTIKAAVLAGIGSAILPPSAVLDEWRAGRVRIRRLRDPALSRDVVLCVSQDIPLSTPAQAVHAMVTAVVDRLVLGGEWPVCGESGSVPQAHGHAEAPDRT